MIGENADIGGNLHCLADYLDSWHVGVVDESSGRRQSEIGPGADGQNPIFVGLHEIAIPGDEEALLLIGNDHLGLELAQDTIGAPVLGKLDDCSLQIALELIEFGLESAVECQTVSRAAGESDQNLALAGSLHLVGTGLDDGVVEGHLAVARHARFAVAADHKDGGGREAIHGVWIVAGGLDSWHQS